MRETLIEAGGTPEAVDEARPGIVNPRYLAPPAADIMSEVDHNLVVA